jgi:hypothetical protein
MPGFVVAQPPLQEDRSHAQPRAGPFSGLSMASMARTGLEWPRSVRGAEGGVEPARSCPALHSKISSARWGGRVPQRAGRQSRMELPASGR